MHSSKLDSCRTKNFSLQPKVVTDQQDVSLGWASIRNYRRIRWSAAPVRGARPVALAQQMFNVNAMAVVSGLAAGPHRAELRCLAIATGEPREPAFACRFIPAQAMASPLIGQVIDESRKWQVVRGKYAYPRSARQYVLQTADMVYGTYLPLRSSPFLARMVR